MVSPVGTSSASYQLNGWQASRTLPNGSVTSYAYNPVGALSSQTNKTSTASVLSSYTGMTYDGVFNLTGFNASVANNANFSGAKTYRYDSQDRLLGEGFYQPEPTFYGTYGYDGAGNATNNQGGVVHFNSDNQPTATNYVFDGNGNPTTYQNQGAAYDPESRLTNYGGLTHGYRADGLRAWKQGSGGKTYFLYDQGEPIIEMTGSGSVTAVNVFAPDGLVARQAGSSTIQYTFDQQGNVSQRLDSSQNVLSDSLYSAYGSESNSGTAPTDPFGYNARWGYYLDRETGLYLCQHRFYDPAVGRWLNRDPIGATGGINVYGYCASGPVGRADWNGENWVAKLLIAALDPMDSMMADACALTGQIHVDPEGNFYVTGGIVSRLNPRRNAITVGGYTFLNPSDEADYLQAPKWRGHENHHSDQNVTFGSLYLPLTAACYAIGAKNDLTFGPTGGPFGHDRSPLEIDADNNNGSGTYRSPWAPIWNLPVPPIWLGKQALGL